MLEDARLLELQWLTEFELGHRTQTRPYTNQTRVGNVIEHLMTNRYITLKDGTTDTYVITHAGAVHRAELEQQLKANRIKEPMELLWDGRHFQ